MSGIKSASNKHALYVQELGIQDSSDDTTLSKLLNQNYEY